MRGPVSRGGRQAGGTDISSPSLARLVEGARGRALGVVSACVLIVLVVAADVAEGPATAYVGVLTAAPLLAAVFASPGQVLAVGVLSLVAGQGYAASAGAGGSSAQMVRLGFLAAGTALAVVAAALRQVRDRQLQQVLDVAEAAQGAILRPAPPAIGRLRFAACYRSAAAAANVGGDFYDVADTPYGVRIVVGDVRGKGLEAVHLAAAVLGSFREAAHTAGPDLAAVAEAVSASTTRLIDVEDFVTASFVQLDPQGRGHLVRCGHPPPLVLGANGVRTVDGGVDQPPLGLVVHPAAEPLSLDPGQRLLLFTDGLSEARDRSGRFFDPVEQVAGLRDRPFDTALDDLLAAVDAHTGHGLQDDLALLLVEHAPDGRRPATS